MHTHVYHICTRCLTPLNTSDSVANTNIVLIPEGTSYISYFVKQWTIVAIIKLYFS